MDIRLLCRILCLSVDCLGGRGPCPRHHWLRIDGTSSVQPQQPHPGIDELYRSRRPGAVLAAEVIRTIEGCGPGIPWDPGPQPSGTSMLGQCFGRSRRRHRISAAAAPVVRRPVRWAPASDFSVPDTRQWRVAPRCRSGCFRILRALRRFLRVRGLTA